MFLFILPAKYVTVICFLQTGAHTEHSRASVSQAVHILFPTGPTHLHVHRDVLLGSGKRQTCPKPRSGAEDHPHKACFGVDLS